MLSKEESDYWEGESGALYFRDRICMPNDEILRKQILTEVLRSRYTIHPGKVKVYDLTKGKVEHKKSAGLLQPLPVLE
jgi:hypothetical protein